MSTFITDVFADLTPYDLVVQAIGFVAMGSALSAFGNKCDRRFYLILMAAHGLFCLHFVLLDAWAGAGANLIAIARAWFARDRRDNTTYACLMIAYATMACLTVRAPIDLMAALAPLIGTTMMFKLTGWRMRTGMLVPSTMWLSYNALNGSVAGVINELLILSMNLTTIARLLLSSRTAARCPTASPK